MASTPQNTNTQRIFRIQKIILYFEIISKNRSILVFFDGLNAYKFDTMPVFPSKSRLFLTFCVVCQMDNRDKYEISCFRLRLSAWRTRKEKQAIQYANALHHPQPVKSLKGIGVLLVLQGNFH